MLGKFVFIGLLIMLAGCAKRESPVEAEPAVRNEAQDKIEEKVIYGDDDRKDLFQVTNARERALADSTVALVKSTDVAIGNGKANLSGSDYGPSQGLCRNEPFYEQFTAAFCSGFLVAPNLIVTAGHCIVDVGDCSATRFVFGYALKAQGVLPRQVASSEVYSCQRIVARKQVAAGADYAVIELDREVVDISPWPCAEAEPRRWEKH